MSDADLEELAFEARLLKKFKAGKVCSECFTLVLYFNMDCPDHQRRAGKKT